MRKLTALAGLLALVALAALAAVLKVGPEDGNASSHREAPLIADDPSADITDVYAFRSPDKPGTVTLLANVIPGEDPGAGPNWYTFSPTARYNLKIDTNGDVRPDVIYRFQFTRKTGPVLPRRHGTAVRGHAHRQGQDDGRRPRDDAAEQHRAALDPELPRAGCEVDGLVRRRRLDGVRGPA